MTSWKYLIVWGCSLTLLLLGSACSQGKEEGQPRAVATFYPLYFFASQIAGGQMRVQQLIPAGVEPHDWDPQPRDVAFVDGSAVFVYNGGGLEPWAQRLLDGIRSSTVVVIDVSKGVPLLAGEDKAGGRGQGSIKLDPHLWLDPVLTQHQAKLIEEGFARANPANEDTYTENGKTLIAALQGLDKEFREGLALCQRRAIITSHDAFGYLARRYGLKVASIAGLSPQTEPSPTQLARTVQFAKEYQATHIFFEKPVSPALASVIARETGAQTLELNPLETLTQEQLDAGLDYFAVMRQNLANLRLALGCQ